jgi:hypothetical protein
VRTPEPNTLVAAAPTQVAPIAAGISADSERTPEPNTLVAAPPALVAEVPVAVVSADDSLEVDFTVANTEVTEEYPEPPRSEPFGIELTPPVSKQRPPAAARVEAAPADLDLGLGELTVPSPPGVSSVDVDGEVEMQVVAPVTTVEPATMTDAPVPQSAPMPRMDQRMPVAPATRRGAGLVPPATQTDVPVALLETATVQVHDPTVDLHDIVRRGDSSPRHPRIPADFTSIPRGSEPGITLATEPTLLPSLLPPVSVQTEDVVERRDAVDSAFDVGPAEPETGADTRASAASELAETRKLPAASPPPLDPTVRVSPTVPADARVPAAFVDEVALYAEWQRVSSEHGVAARTDIDPQVANALCELADASSNVDVPTVAPQGDSAPAELETYEGSQVRTTPVGRRPRTLIPGRAIPDAVAAHLDRAHHAFERADLEGAAKAAQEAFACDLTGQGNEIRYAERALILRIFEAQLGSLSRVPHVVQSGGVIATLGLDHRAGFMLDRIDGMTSVDDLLDIAGMPRIDALYMIVTLLKHNVITL